MDDRVDRLELELTMEPFEEEVEHRVWLEQLHAIFEEMIEKLLDDQEKLLFRMVYYDERPLKDFCSIAGVSYDKAARMKKTIFRKIRQDHRNMKKLKSFLTSM